MNAPHVCVVCGKLVGKELGGVVKVYPDGLGGGREEYYCADILVQISSVQEALRGVGRELMRNHLQHCAAQAISKGSRQDAVAMYEELLDLMYRHAR